MAPHRDLPLTPDLLQQVRQKYDNLKSEDEKLLKAIMSRDDIKLPRVKEQKVTGAAVTPPNMSILRTKPVNEQLKIVQDYIKKLGYNYTPIGQFFPIMKRASLKSLMDTAKRMIKYSLPIRCLEATVCAAYMTNGISGLDRFMMSFLSSAGGNSYRHIVLVVHYKGLFGALGLSRRPELMFKDLKFRSLNELVNEFETSYEKNGHRLEKLYLGLPISHDEHSHEKIVWRHCAVSLSHQGELQKALTDYRKFISQ